MITNTEIQAEVYRRWPDMFYPEVSTRWFLIEEILKLKAEIKRLNKEKVE